MNPRIAKALELGILDEKEHATLIKRMDFFSKQTSVPVKFICSPVSDWLSAEQASAVEDWALKRDAGLDGLLFRGAPKASVSAQFAAIAGWMLRNKHDARMYTADRVADEYASGVLPDCSVMLVPDFYQSGSKLWPSVVAGLCGALLQRHHRGLFTVVYVESVKDL